MTLQAYVNGQKVAHRVTVSQAKCSVCENLSLYNCIHCGRSYCKEHIENHKEKVGETCQ